METELKFLRNGKQHPTSCCHLFETLFIYFAHVDQTICEPGFLFAKEAFKCILISNQTFNCTSSDTVCRAMTNNEGGLIELKDNETLQFMLNTLVMTSMPFLKMFYFIINNSFLWIKLL